jgi:[ribosomal protein S18]-alanine N-acetyltransferase
VKICLLEPRDVHAKRAAEDGQSQIRRSLEQLGHQVVELSCNPTLYAELREQHPDVVFNAPSVYGTGQGRLVPAVIEMAGLRYTGSGVLALSLGAKYAQLFPLLFAAGIPLPPFRVLEVGQPSSLHDLRYPLVYYGNNGPPGSAVATEAALSDVVRLACPHAEGLLVEQVKGRKVTIFALDQVPLFHLVENEVRSLVKETCQLIEARGLTRFDLVWADTPTLVSIDVAPDPLQRELLRQASRAGCNEKKLMQMLLERAGRDSDVLRSEEVIIRPFSLTDSELAQLVKIENASFTTDAYQIEDFRNVYRKCSELSVVAEIEGQIAGYMMTGRLPDRGNVFSVAIAPDYRRRDIGEALFRYTVKRLNEWGIAKIELEVRKSNAAGVSFWTRMGFAPVSTIPCFYDDGSEALLMRKVIGAP